MTRPLRSASALVALATIGVATAGCTRFDSSTVPQEDCAGSRTYRDSSGLEVGVPDPDWDPCNRRNAAAVERARAEHADPLHRIEEVLTAGTVAGLIIVAGGLYAAATCDNAVPKGRRKDGPAAGIVRATAARRVALGWVAVFVGVMVIASGFPEAHVPVAVGSGLAIVALVARAVNCTRALRGFELLERRWKADQVEAVAAAGPAVTPHDDLGIGIAAMAPDAPDVPEPRVTWEDAIRVAGVGAVAGTGGVPPGSALDVLTDGRGKPGPARMAFDRVVREFKVGTVEKDAEGRQVWTPHLVLHSVSAAAGGDAVVRIRATIATVSDSDLRKVENAFLREARLATASEWTRETTTGLYAATVTTRDTQPEADGGPVPGDFDSEWS